MYMKEIKWRIPIIVSLGYELIGPLMTECEPSGGGQARWVPDQTPTCRQITVGPTPPPVGGKYIM